MINTRKSFAPLFIFFFILTPLFTGCVEKKNIPLIQQIAPVREEPVCRIAIIPFNNKSEYAQGDTLAYRIFIAELQRAGNFFIAQEGDVRKILYKFRINPKENPDFEEMKVLASRLDAQLVITGEVIEMSEGNRAGRLIPSVKLKLRVIDGMSGKIMWDTYHSKSGEDYRKVLHFGYVNTISKLVKHVSTEIINTWFEKGLSQCSDS